MREFTATGDNPLCGDTITVTLELDGFFIADAHWQGYGCELCLGTVDRLLDEIKGKLVSEVAAITLEELLDWYGSENIGWTRKNCIQLPLKVIHSALALPQAQ
ncbi:MAG: iron-sulfur cluster assembly scaffold protein [Coriobacteriales bacterium]|jgi:NifU-like protein involved in Fe-S cluster formation|nr:iron-sulfur cluster assembly scaffold protein [Coriobacteriales bacterium]